MNTGLRIGLRERLMTVIYSTPKCRDARYIITIVTPSMRRESNAAMERFLVLKPPVGTTLIA